MFFVVLRRTDLIHISNITFYYNRFTTSIEVLTIEEWEDLEFKF